MKLSKILVLFFAISTIALSALSVAPATSIIKLNTDNTVYLLGEVNMVSMDKLSRDLIELNKKRGNKNYPIYLVINSPGGSIYAGQNFIEFAKNFKNVHTITVFAASMGSAIVQMLPGERLVTNHGVMMFHRASGSFSGQFEDGEVEQQLAFWKSIVRSMESKISKRLKMSLEDYKNAVKDELWVFGENNLKQNTADRLVDLECSQDLIDKTIVVKESILGIIEFETEYSSCPLLLTGKVKGE